MARAPDVDRRMTHGDILPAEKAPPSWGEIAFWAAVWAGLAAFLAYCGSL